MAMSMILGSIVIEAIRTVYYYCYYYFYQDVLHKKTHKLYSNISIHLKKHNKEHKQLSFRCKAMNFCSNICLKKYSWHKM